MKLYRTSREVEAAEEAEQPVSGGTSSTGARSGPGKGRQTKATQKRAKKKTASESS